MRRKTQVILLQIKSAEPKYQNIIMQYGHPNQQRTFIYHKACTLNQMPEKRRKEYKQYSLSNNFHLKPVRNF